MAFSICETATAPARPSMAGRPNASSIVGAASSTDARDAPARTDGANTGVDTTANTSANASADPTPTAGGSGGTGLVAPNKSSKLRRRLLHHAPLARNDRLVSSVLLVPRKTMAAIVDPARRIEVDEARGIVAERLRTVIKHAVAPCDVAIKRSFYVRKAAGGLQGGRVRVGVDRPASMDVRRPFQCRLMGCDVVGHVEWDLPDDDATTVGGLIMHEARLLPDAGQTFEFYGYRFRILRRVRNQIAQIRITPPSRRRGGQGSGDD